MKKVVFALLVAVTAAGCTTTGPGGPAAPAKPELVGKVPNQPGNCYFKDPAGKVFIAECPKA